MTRTKHALMGIIVYASALISATLSARYGYISAGESADIFERYIMAATFAIFDIVVILLASELTSRFLTKAAAKILLIVLFCLSCFSGAAYMLGQQSQDQSTQTTMLKRQINMLDESLAKLDPLAQPNTIRALRRERSVAYERLQSIYNKQGGEVTKGNAMFIYAGNLLGISPESLATIMRLFTMFSLNLCGIILAAMRAQSEVTYLSYNRDQASVASAANDSFDDKGIKIEAIKAAILSSQVKPSVTAVAKAFCGNNRAEADYYLQILEENNVIKNNGHGKKRSITA